MTGFHMNKTKPSDQASINGFANVITLKFSQASFTFNMNTPECYMYEMLHQYEYSFCELVYTDATFHSYTVALRLYALTVLKISNT